MSKTTKPTRFKLKQPVTYKARTHSGEGTFAGYETSLRGEWANVKRKDTGELIALRPSQISAKP